MAQVGIGQLQHASAQRSAAPSKKRGVSKKKQKHPEPKEGQLAVDIMQTDTEMIIVCPIAGVEKADIRVAIQDDVLTIRGERKKIDELKSNKQHLIHELYWGTFSRSIVLPDHIDRKGITARVHEHMLVITIPKTEDFKTRIIHINE